MSIYNFWGRVKDQMKAHKITQEKFAEYIRVPRSTFFRWQQLGIIPDLSTAYNMATALGVSLENLVTGQDRKGEEERMKQTEERKNTEAQVKNLVVQLHEEVVKF